MFFHAQELSAEYKAYIKSDLWHSQRFEALMVYGHICPGCGERERLDVHHLRYGKFTEIQPARDLIPLCPHCHQVVHNSDTLRSKLKECGRWKARWDAELSALREKLVKTIKERDWLVSAISRQSQPQ